MEATTNNTIAASFMARVATDRTLRVHLWTVLMFFECLRIARLIPKPDSDKIFQLANESVSAQYPAVRDICESARHQRG